MSLDVSNPEGIATGLEARPKVDERDTTMHIDYELVVTEPASPVPDPSLLAGPQVKRLTIENDSPRATP
jgi:hypothetical protein